MISKKWCVIAMALSVATQADELLVDRISLAANGVEASGDSFSASLSADGRVAVYATNATNVVSGSSYGSYVARDLETGDITVLAELDRPLGLLPSVSGDGRFIAFRTSEGLVPEDGTDTLDVYIYDQVSGTYTQASKVSSAAGRHANAPSISYNGRYLSFSSSSSFMVPGDSNNAADVFVFDRLANDWERVSVSSDGVQGNSYSGENAISGDGRFVAFWSNASNLIAGDVNGRADLFIHDREAGVTEKVASSGTTNPQGQYYDVSYPPSLSYNGRYVAFTSSAEDVVSSDTNGFADIFVFDRVTAQVERVNIGLSGVQANGNSNSPQISDDGRYVAFVSLADNLVVDDFNGAADAFVFDRVSQQMTILSNPLDNGDLAYHDAHMHVSMTFDGSRVLFTSPAANMVLDDGNNAEDVFVSHPGTLAAASFDTDLDTMPDVWEVDFGLNPNNASDAVSDFDSDGIGNAGEYEYGTDPTSVDSDDDMLPELWEVNNGYNPTDSSDALLDSDGDGLTTFDEYQAGTNPRNADSDVDGLPDKWELENGFNPTDSSDAQLDTDGDGLTTLDEFEAGTDPYNADSDSDSLPDKWELDNGLNPNDASDASQDADGDGYTNKEEYEKGTDPQDSSSKPRRSIWEILFGWLFH
ncbi:MAG: hypothetical protein MI864_18645 [Pseudomonadales bacterium]|nr:hypothetical protein [Pseudomonadales bacterium]